MILSVTCICTYTQQQEMENGNNVIFIVCPYEIYSNQSARYIHCIELLTSMACMHV